MALVFYRLLIYEGSFYFLQDKIHLNRHDKNHQIIRKVAFQVEQI